MRLNERLKGEVWRKGGDLYQITVSYLGSNIIARCFVILSVFFLDIIKTVFAISPHIQTEK
jgi:hypothetical protein